MKKILLILGLGLINHAICANGINNYTNNIQLLTPGLPHPNNKPPYVEVYAHRGARSFAPENTMPGYKTALAIGTNWVDMDVGITKDGIILVDHDIWLNPDILRKNQRFWARNSQKFYKQLEDSPNGLEKNIQPFLVKNLSLAQLQQYDAGMINRQSPYSKYFPDQYAINGTKMPALQEVIDYVNSIVMDKSIGFQIEIKNDPQHPNWTVSVNEFAEKINKFLLENQLLERSEIQSFDWRPLYELHKLNPKAKLAFLVSKDDIVRMHSTDIKQAGLWSGGILLKDYNNSLPQMVKALGGSCYEPEDIALTKKDLDEAHKLGLKVVVWTWPENSGQVFDPVLIDKLIKWGVDGIITDDPARLNSMLAARGMPTPKNFPGAAISKDVYQAIIK